LLIAKKKKSPHGARATSNLSFPIPTFTSLGAVTSFQSIGRGYPSTLHPLPTLLFCAELSLELVYRQNGYHPGSNEMQGEFGSSRLVSASRFVRFSGSAIFRARDIPSMAHRNESNGVGRFRSHPLSERSLVCPQGETLPE